MRIMYALLAVVLWAQFLSIGTDAGIVVSDNMQLITICMIATGALAGGD